MTNLRIEPRHLFVATGLVAIAAYVGIFNYLLANRTYDQWGALIIGPLLVIVSIPIISAVAKRTGDEWLLKVAIAGLVIKLFASVARYWTAFVFYDGSADAAGYNKGGAEFAEDFRHLMFTTEVFGPDVDRRFIGTGFIIFFTALVYAISGPTLVGGYLIFSWIGFWGLFLAVQAFRTAVPGGHVKRYAYLTFFLPSLLFWPSGLGKEALMLFGVGLAMFGVARFMTSRRGGLWLTLLGLGCTTLVRPHVTLLLAFAILIAFAVRPSRRVTSLTPVVKIGGTLLLGVLAFVALRATADFLGLEDLSRESLQTAMTEAQDNTAQGGSRFSGAAVESPLDLPWATVTVLYRPFPWEVDSIQVLLASAEGMLLLYLTWRYRSSIVQIPRYLRRMPYVTFCVAYLGAFITIFAGFANFGILVRQRSLALPVFLVLLALPVLKRTRRRPAPTEPQRDQAMSTA